MPKLSVIIPCYNVEHLMGRAVESVFAQTFSDMEIILVDDGAKDGTPALCDLYAGKDARVKVIHQPNGGLSAARNAGMALASGEYLAFLDADDYLRRDAYEKMFAAMEKYGTDCACCGYTHVFDDGQIGETVAAPFADGVHNEEAVMQGIVLPLLQDRLREGMFTGMVWRYIFRTETVRKHDLTFTDAYLEDELFLIRYFARPTRIASVDEGLYFYFMNRNSLTRSYRSDMTEIYRRILRAKELLVQEFSLPVRSDWKDNCAWMELLADVGNEFGRGHRVPLGEHIRNLKALADVPEYHHALEHYVPRDMDRRKTVVAQCMRRRWYLPLALLYRFKNRHME